MTRARIRPIIWALVAVTLMLVVLSLAVGVAQGEPLHLGTVFLVAYVAVLLPLGVLVAFRQPANPIGWIFLGVALTVGLGSLAGSYADYWTSGEGGSDGLGKLAAWYGSSSWIPWVLVPATFLLLLFPDGKLPGSRWRPVAWSAGIGIGLLLVTGLLTPGPLEDYQQVRNPYGVDTGVIDPLTRARVPAGGDRNLRLDRLARPQVPAREPGAARADQVDRAGGRAGRRRGPGGNGDL